MSRGGGAENNRCFWLRLPYLDENALIRYFWQVSPRDGFSFPAHCFVNGVPLTAREPLSPPLAVQCAWHALHTFAHYVLMQWWCCGTVVGATKDMEAGEPQAGRCERVRARLMRADGWSHVGDHLDRLAMTCRRAAIDLHARRTRRAVSSTECSPPLAERLLLLDLINDDQLLLLRLLSASLVRSTC